MDNPKSFTLLFVALLIAAQTLVFSDERRTQRNPDLDVMHATIAARDFEQAPRKAYGGELLARSSASSDGEHR